MEYPFGKYPLNIFEGQGCNINPKRWPGGLSRGQIKDAIDALFQVWKVHPDLDNACLWENHLRRDKRWPTFDTSEELELFIRMAIQSLSFGYQGFRISTDLSMSLSGCYNVEVPSRCSAEEFVPEELVETIFHLLRAIPFLSCSDLKRANLFQVRNLYKKVTGETSQRYLLNGITRADLQIKTFEEVLESTEAAILGGVSVYVGLTVTTYKKARLYQRAKVEKVLFKDGKVTLYLRHAEGHVIETDSEFRVIKDHGPKYTRYMSK